MMTVEDLLSRLKNVRRRGPGSWMARCPAHEDHTPSLSVRECDNGTLLLCCFSSCRAADIVAAIGLQLRDLFARSHTRRISRVRREAREHARMVALVAREDLKAGKPLSHRDRAAILGAIRVLRGSP